MRHLVIDGIDLLSEYGLWISGENVYNGAEANVETVKVPGRNGDLVYSNRRYNNFKLEYACCIPSSFSSNIVSLRARLYNEVGYRRIEDTYFPQMFRLGRITGNMNPSTIAWNNDTGLFKIAFDCKPQHFYKAGETSQTYTASGTISNGTMFDALPFLRVYGRGTVTINNIPVKILEHNSPYTDIDCEIMDAFCEDANLNPYVEVSGDQFPKLSPGTNLVTLGSGITRVQITPRYWTL